MIKRPIHQEYVKFLNMCVPNNRALKYINQKLVELKKKIGKYKSRLEISVLLFH